MNLGQPDVERIFMRDNKISNDSIFTKMNVYCIGVNNNNTNKRHEEIIKILTGNSIEDNSMIVQSKKDLSEPLQLYKRKSFLGEFPRYIVRIKLTSIAPQIFAFKYSGKELVIINKSDGIFKIEGTINELFSKVLASPNNVDINQFELSEIPSDIKFPVSLSEYRQLELSAYNTLEILAR